MVSPQSINPVGVVKWLMEEHRPAGIGLLITLGVLATLAIARIWQINFETSRSAIVTIVGLFFIALVLSRVSQSNVMANTISWFFIGIIIIYIVLLFIAVFCPRCGLPPAFCLIPETLVNTCENQARNIAPNSQETLPAVKSVAEEVAKAENACRNIDISRTPGSAPDQAWWCGGGGATRTTLIQSRRDPTPSCRSFAARSFGNLFQNQLYVEAVQFAKAGKFDDAFERIDACQCHNPQAQVIIREGKQRMLCFLRVQEAKPHA